MRRHKSLPHPLSRADLQATRELVSLCLDPTGTELATKRECWDELLPLALYHGVAPLLWSRLKNQELAHPVRVRLAGLYTANLVRNQQLKAQQEKVLAAFVDKAVPAWPLKGTHLSDILYGDLALRQVTDIDILIQPRSLQKADQVLADLGYVRNVHDEIARVRRNRAFVYLKSTCQGSLFLLDLHQRLSPYSQRDPLVERIWANGMTQENLLIYLCVNQVLHRFARLKYLLDIKMLIDRATNEIDWDLVVKIAKETEFAPGIYHSLESVCEFAGTRVPASVLAALRPSWFSRKFVQCVLGFDTITALSWGSALAGPYGAFAVVACTEGTSERLNHVRKLLFPPASEIRARRWAQPEQATFPLYLDRLVRKVPTAVRDLVKSVF